MISLLEHDVANTPSAFECALGHGRTEQKTSECRCKCRVFARMSGRERGSGLPLDGIVRKRGMCVVLVRVSPEPFRPIFGHCFGAYATPGGRLALLLCYAPSGLRFPSATDPP
jgi:hypothetical protein